MQTSLAVSKMIHNTKVNCHAKINYEKLTQYSRNISHL